MDFEWSEPERALHARMRALGTEIAGLSPDERHARLAAEGVLGLPIPADRGGGGFSLVATAHAYEGLGETLGDAGLLLAAGAHLFGVVLPLDKVGTPEQRARWIPELASGRAIATIAATESRAGSDVASVETVHEATPGGGFRVTGSKCYVTNADRSDLFVVLARDAGGTGVSALLVPAKLPGVRVGAPLATAGLANARLAEVTFEGVEVGADAVLGRVGGGRTIFQIAMTYERALILAFRLGAMQRQLEEAVRFARERRVGGEPIAKHESVSHRVARMKLRLETSRLLLYKTAWQLERGERGQVEAALTKWQVAEAALQSALDALSLRGGSGFLEASGLPGAVDDTIGATIHSGTQDVLAGIVARWLGL
jgi:alkylation response protein AidB-like acyl-CoA dehydrogenase